MRETKLNGLILSLLIPVGFSLPAMAENITAAMPVVVPSAAPFQVAVTKGGNVKSYQFAGVTFNKDSGQYTLGETVTFAVTQSGNVKLYNSDPRITNAQYARIIKDEDITGPFTVGEIKKSQPEIYARLMGRHNQGVDESTIIYLATFVYKNDLSSQIYVTFGEFQAAYKLSGQPTVTPTPIPMPTFIPPTPVPTILPVQHGGKVINGTTFFTNGGFNNFNLKNSYDSWGEIGASVQMVKDLGLNLAFRINYANNFGDGRNTIQGLALGGGVEKFWVEDGSVSTGLYYAQGVLTSNTPASTGGLSVASYGSRPMGIDRSVLSVTNNATIAFTDEFGVSVNLLNAMPVDLKIMEGKFNPTNVYNRARSFLYYDFNDEPFIRLGLGGEVVYDIGLTEKYNSYGLGPMITFQVGKVQLLCFYRKQGVYDTSVIGTEFNFTF